MNRFAAMLCVGLLACLPARAQVNVAEPDPAAWLRAIYALYQRAEKNPALEEQASYDLVERRASRALGALFKKNHDCEKEGQGTCAIDWDFVVDGQDSQLSKVKVGATKIVGDKASVTVSFVNLGSACVNVYEFVREDGVWKVDDIETRTGDDKPIRIAEQLRDYKP